jgi:CHAT domain-containing protein
MRTAPLVRMALLAALLASVRASAGPAEEGDAAAARGDAAGALRAWADALAQARARGDQPAEVALLHKLAATHRDLGQTLVASRILDLAEPLSTTPALRGDLALSRALLLRHTGDLAQARILFDQSFSQYQSAQDPAGALNALLGRAAAELDAGRAAEAATTLDRAAPLARALRDPAVLADVSLNRAIAARRLGDLRGAELAVNLALPVLERGPPGPWIDGLVVAARVAQDRGQDPLPFLDRAQGVAGQVTDPARTAHVAAARAAVLAARGAPAASALDLAIEGFERAGRPADALRARLDRADLEAPGLQEARRLLHVAQSSPDPRRLARAQLVVAEVLETSDPAGAAIEAGRAEQSARDLALPEVRWRALAVLGRTSRDPRAAVSALEEAAAILQERRNTLGGAVPHPRERALLQALAEASLQQGDLQKAAAAMTAAGRLEAPPATGGVAAAAAARDWLETQVGASLGTEREGALRARLAEAKIAFAAEVDSLRARVSDLDSRVRIAPEDLEAAQAEIPADAAVIQPILLPDRVVLLVLRRDNLVVRTSPIPGAEVEATLARLSRALRAGMRDSALLDPLADRLGEVLWAPLAADLAGVRVVALAVAGPLRNLPAAMLRHDRRYLIERYAVVTLAHVGSLRANKQDTKLSPGNLLLVGDPDGSLPGARAEVEALRSRWPDASALVGPQATFDAVRARLEGRSVVHFATHGRIDTVEPARSYLVLAGPEGRLGYGDIPGLAPHLAATRLVVLSACESGRPVLAEQDGVVSIQGLASQFRRAGVETLVASLWRVDDEGTRGLMLSFYAALADGADVAEALARAQRASLADPNRRSPWTWAAFVVAGAWAR